MADENTSNNPPEDNNTESPNNDNQQGNPAGNAPASEQPTVTPPANAFNSPEFDASEITRKLDGIIETQSILTKAIAELMSNGGNAKVNPGPDAGESSRPTDVYGGKPIDAINNLKL